MRAFTSFIRHTFTGGIMFLLPITVLGIVFAKAHAVFKAICFPLAKALKIHDKIFLGIDGTALLALILLIILCFTGGLLIRAKIVKKAILKLENSVLIRIPGYVFLKNLTADAIGEETAHMMIPVLVKNEMSWQIGFLIDEGDEMSIVFIPQAPNNDSGEIKTIHTSRVIKINLSIDKTNQLIKNYGRGTIELLKENKLL